jgi:hypothetical protein
VSFMAGGVPTELAAEEDEDDGDIVPVETI